MGNDTSGTSKNTKLGTSRPIAAKESKESKEAPKHACTHKHAPKCSTKKLDKFIRSVKYRYSQTSREKIKINNQFNDFFNSHHKKYLVTHPELINTLDIHPKRIVFISIHALHRTWKECPTLWLYNSIFVLPLKLECIRIMDPDEADHDKHGKHEYHALFEDAEFLALLRWKAHQNLAIFLLDNDRESEDGDDEEDLIAPVWRRISRLLQTLHDPLKEDGGKYQALIFDEEYWKNESTTCKKDHKVALDLHMTEFCVTWQDVVRDLSAVTMQFATMQVILKESNASLDVLTNYPAQLPTQQSKEKDKMLDENWWVAEDYHDDDDVDKDEDEKDDESSEIP